MTYGDLTGKNFGGAIVIGFNRKENNGQLIWDCKCWCGNIFQARTTDLVNLKKTTCFSYHHDDIIGKKFGKLTATQKFIIDKGHRKFLCKCDCGNETYVETYSLLSGKTKSCGCLLKETKNNYRHGMTDTRIHRIWYQIICRTKYKGDTSYKNYGGRGIKIFKEWEKFENFYEWAMANGYRDDLTIDRIDVNGDYCPENCRWATPKEQSNNTRANRFIEYNGEKKTMSQWAEYAGIPYRTFYYRYTLYNWSIEDCIKKPVDVKKRNKKAVEE